MPCALIHIKDAMALLALHADPSCLRALANTAIFCSILHECNEADDKAGAQADTGNE